MAYSNISAFPCQCCDYDIWWLYETSPENTSSCSLHCFWCKLLKKVIYFRSFWPWKSGALNKRSHSSLLIQCYWFVLPWSYISLYIPGLSLDQRSHFVWTTWEKKNWTYFYHKEWTLKLSVAWVDYMGRKSCLEALFGRDYTFQGFILLADLSVNGENAYFILSLLF